MEGVGLNFKVLSFESVCSNNSQLTESLLSILNDTSL